MDSESFQNKNASKVSSEAEIIAISAAKQLRSAGVSAGVAGEKLKEAILLIPEEYWDLIDLELEHRRKRYIANVIINSITWLVIFCVVTSIAFWMVRIFIAN